MLSELRIRNFAIIESLALPLAPGFNALTGETGAGKSIIVGALGLLLGERANADVIRSGADRATVEGTFDVAERPEIRGVLDQHGIDAEDLVVVLKREVTRGTRAGVDQRHTRKREHPGRSGPRAGEHPRTTRSANASRRGGAAAHSRCVRRRGRRCREHGSGTRRAHRDGPRDRQPLQASSRSGAPRRLPPSRRARDRRAKLVDGEDVRLEDEARRLENADELRALAGGLASTLDGDEDAVLHRLGAIAKQLSSIQRIDPTLSRLQEMLDSAYFAIEALARELTEYEATVELDPSRLEEVRRRRDLLFRLTKKYGGSISEVIRAGTEARAELDLVDSADMDLKELESRERAARAALVSSARALTAKRQAGAKRLARAVDKVLPELGMPDGHLTVSLNLLPQIGEHGAEDVEFRVALNVGHEPRALSRVASGGELSRVMLALKTILARLDRVPTLVFDEVDAGIGGRVGLQVGDTLRRVASDHQVFAITHLPQIAARAHHHIVVSKGARSGVTTADVSIVTDD